MIEFKRGSAGPWEPIFAWRPTRDIHGELHWLKPIYRRERSRVVWPPRGWEYGTIFDVIRDQ